MEAEWLRKTFLGKQTRQISPEVVVSYESGEGKDERGELKEKWVWTKSVLGIWRLGGFGMWRMETWGSGGDTDEGALDPRKVVFFFVF